MASFHGLSVDVNGTASEEPASIVFAVRPREFAQRAMYQRVLAGGATVQVLEDAGVPVCPLVAVIGARSTLDVPLQLGGRSRNDTITAAASAFLASKTVSYPSTGLTSSPVVATAGSSLLIADAHATMWDAQAVLDDVSGGTSDVTAARNWTEPLPLAPAGTGRLWHTAFCPRDAVRRKSEPQYAVVPYVCRDCMGTSEASFGGVSSFCVSRPTGSLCAGQVSSSGLPLDTVVQVTDGNLSLIQGALYRVRVRGVSAAGRWYEREGPMLMVDTTPPLAPSGGIGDGITNDRDLHYTNETTHVGVFQQGAFTEDASGIAYYMAGVSTMPCDGMLWRRCDVETQVINPADKASIELSNCSPYELSWRRNLSAALGYSNWRLLGTEGYPIPFDLDPESVWSVAPLTNIGLNLSFAWEGITVPHGTLAFGCVIAYNHAGLRTAVSSTGILYDTTPPVVVRGSVNDGILGSPDFDSQSMLDGLVANWQAFDFESGVLLINWAYTSDPAPVLDAYLDLDEGLDVDWDAVQSSIALVGGGTPAWDSAPDTPMMKSSGLSLVKNRVYYAAVRAQNRAGLYSNIECSDGVTVGKNEFKPDPSKASSMGFNSESSSTAYASPEEKRAAEGGTVGSMALPAGGSAGASSIVAGVTDEDDYAGNSSTPAVDPRNTTSPSKNLQFGDYSFAIKAKDDDGKTIPGFRFAKPMTISLFYDVPKSLPAGTPYAPSLNLFNIETGQWEAAVLSCPLQDQMEFNDVVRR